MDLNTELGGLLLNTVLDEEEIVLGQAPASSPKEKDKKGVKEVVPRNLRKMERKSARKVHKMKQGVPEHLKISVSGEPDNEWLFISGFGIATGTSRKDILAYLTPQPVEVRLYGDKLYTFVRCSSIQDAITVKNKYQGSNYKERQPLYIGCVGNVEAIPEEDISYLGSFQTKLPDGLSIYLDFVTPEEEDCMIRNLYVDTSQVTNLKKRTVTHFGYEFRYGTNDVDSNCPLPEKIPDYVMPVVSRIIKTSGTSAEPDQLTVNQYSPGQGIPPHCDTHSCFEGPIISLSLGSDAVMDFKQGNSVSSVNLPARSLLVMDGESRYGWTHGITPTTWEIVPDTSNGGITVQSRGLRISLTFRKLQRGELVCHCKFPNLCDTQKKKAKITDDNASDLENELVHKVYDEIAGHFTETRHKPWPRIKEFVESLKPGDRMLDVGCANGKYFGINKDIVEVGMDMSTGLLVKCFEKGNEVVRANALSLPFHDAYFDCVISIAVLHHIATKKRRLRFIEEIIRVLSPGGLGLIYVWAKDQIVEKGHSTWSERQQERNVPDIPDTCMQTDSVYPSLPIHAGEVQFRENDMVVPWVNNQKKQNTVYHRYYHVFDKGELDELVTETKPAPKILDSYYEQGNWVVKFQKQGI